MKTKVFLGVLLSLVIILGTILFLSPSPSIFATFVITAIIYVVGAILSRR